MFNWSKNKINLGKVVGWSWDAKGDNLTSTPIAINEQ